MFGGKLLRKNRLLASIRLYGSVAQSGERQPVTLEVVGSKPIRVAILGYGLGRRTLAFKARDLGATPSPDEFRIAQRKSN